MSSRTVKHDQKSNDGTGAPDGIESHCNGTNLHLEVENALKAASSSQQLQHFKSLTTAHPTKRCSTPQRFRSPIAVGQCMS